MSQLRKIGAAALTARAEELAQWVANLEAWSSPAGGWENQFYRGAWHRAGYPVPAPSMPTEGRAFAGPDGDWRPGIGAPGARGTLNVITGFRRQLNMLRQHVVATHPTATDAVYLDTLDEYIATYEARIRAVVRSR